MGSITHDTTFADVPYWQVNVPRPLRSVSCPAFLTNVSPKDKGIISTPDSQYHVLTWPEVQSIISRNRIDLFQRVPSELRRYLAYNWELKQQYGSVMEFVMRKRLGWQMPIHAEGRPFEKASDIKVLWNDWPYGIDTCIVHLVVWTKFVLEDDPKTDDLTEKTRCEINKYVDEIFRKRLGRQNVIWFKNWKSLKSVHAVEHFHVMLFDPDADFVMEITNGDVPLSRKVSVMEAVV